MKFECELRSTVTDATNQVLKLSSVADGDRLCMKVSLRIGGEFVVVSAPELLDAVRRVVGIATP